MNAEENVEQKTRVCNGMIIYFIYFNFIFPRRKHIKIQKWKKKINRLKNGSSPSSLTKGRLTSSIITRKCRHFTDRDLNHLQNLAHVD